MWVGGAVRGRGGFRGRGMPNGFGQMNGYGGFAAGQGRGMYNGMGGWNAIPAQVRQGYGWDGSVGAMVQEGGGVVAAETVSPLALRCLTFTCG